MKTFCLIILVQFSLYCTAPAQSVVDTAKSWNNLMFIYNPQHQETERIRFTSDTLIDGLAYYKVVRSTEQDMDGWSFYGYIREDPAQNVWYRTTAGGPDRLILDMDLELGDTVNVYSLLHYSGNEFDNMEYVVTGIDSTLIGGIFRKTYHMSVPEVGEVTRWIATMGSTSGMLHNWNGAVGGDTYDLLCYSENDTVKYMNPGFHTCFVVTGLAVDTNDRVAKLVTTDPGTGDIAFSVTGVNNLKNLVIKFFKVSGQEILIVKGPVEFRVPREKFTPGVSFYSIFEDSRKTGSGSFIVR